jgi:hypothetical protein
VRKRLTDAHPTMISLHQVEDLMLQLGLQLQWEGNRVFLIDRDKKFELKNTDDPDGPTEFPPVFDYKVTFEDGE